jgi:hypothetical protein
MTIHYADIIIYFIILMLIWFLFDNERDSELAIVISIIFTLIYIVVFAILPYNWDDIFRYIKNDVKFVP